MAKIKIHGVSINTEAFKTVADVKSANLFGHLGSASKEAENELLAVLNIVDKKPKKEKVEEVAVETEVTNQQEQEDGTQWPEIAD